MKTVRIIEGRPPGRLASAAILTLKKPGTYDARGRKRIADWLRSQAAMLLREGKNYTTGRFTARYLYPSK